MFTVKTIGSGGKVVKEVKTDNVTRAVNRGLKVTGFKKIEIEPIVEKPKKAKKK